MLRKTITFLPIFEIEIQLKECCLFVGFAIQFIDKFEQLSGGEQTDALATFLSFIEIERSQCSHSKIDVDVDWGMGNET